MAKTSVVFGTEVFPSVTPVLGCVAKVSSPAERTITLSEVAWHDTYSDCWVIIYDRVYDITDFLDEVHILINHLNFRGQQNLTLAASMFLYWYIDAATETNYVLVICLLGNVPSERRRNVNHYL